MISSVYLTKLKVSNQTLAHWKGVPQMQDQEQKTIEINYLMQIHIHILSSLEIDRLSLNKSIISLAPS